MSLIIYPSYYILILFSILGYGFIFSKVFKNSIDVSNLAILGFLGIIFISFISYYSNFITSHSFIHNIFFHICGLISFVYFVRNQKIELNKILKISTFFLLIYFFSIMAKTHDDFGWYHLPYTLNVAQNKLQIGLGHFSIGFKTPSSIFYTNSLFYLPFIKFYSFNFTQLYIFSLALLFFFEIIFKKNNNNIQKLFSLLSFIFIIVVFYRLSEHGTDRSGQILMFVVIAILIDIITDNKLKITKLNLLILFLLYIITIKSYFVIYSILFLPVIMYMVKNPKYFSKLFFSKITIFVSLFLIAHIFIQLMNTGCLLYPLKATCFEDFIWSLNPKDIEYMSNWYELWAKAGANPNFRVADKYQYVSGLNWLNNWFDTYFFNKISDLLLGITLILILTYLSLRKFNKLNTYNKKYNLIFLSIIIISLVWFFNFPQLRYGGFVILGCLIFLPFCLLFNRSLNKKSFKNIKILILISIVIYCGRNINRLFNEVKIYNFKPFNSLNFKLEYHNYKTTDIGDGVILNITEERCWSIDQPCTRKTKLRAIKRQNYVIYYEDQ